VRFRGDGGLGVLYRRVALEDGELPAADTAAAARSSIDART
jgi:hypothetical protein